jgi:transposase InsO family protein
MTQDFELEHFEQGDAIWIMSDQTETEDSSNATLWVPPEFPIDDLDISNDITVSYTMYKRVDKKIKPVPGVFPQEAQVQRQFPHNPLDTLPILTPHPPEFRPSAKITMERMKSLNINSVGFLLPEEEKLFSHIMKLNEDALAFEDNDRGTFKESYFSPYIIPTIPHVPWEYKNMRIPPGIKEKVIEVLKLKISAGVYESSQSSYRSRWFCVIKKNGKLRIVHDLQPLNKVTIRDAGLPPILDDFVEPFAGAQCYTVFDLFWGFDARKLHPASRDLTAFLTPLGLLRITSLPTGFTNSPAEFQKCMTFILHDEIPVKANIFIDDLPIKGPKSAYLDVEGNPETLEENPGIRRFVWEHAQDVHRIMHRVKDSGATFSALKIQLCLPRVLILGQTCTPEGRLPDKSKVEKILNWPDLTTPKEARGFLGLCGTVRIWIPGYSELARPITELWRQNFDFIWDERRKNAFETLKRLVASAPALRSIDYSSDLPIILSVDSSFMSVGIILSQIDENGKRRPARYGSIPFSDVESRYSQPKLELFGLFRALRAFRVYLIGAKNLHVEVDAKYIKGMLNEPDLQPNAAMNRWIQGILLFDIKLIHVPATRFKGPDALSRRRLGEGEEVEEENDSWLDDIALFSGKSQASFHPYLTFYTTLKETKEITSTSTSFVGLTNQDSTLHHIFKFLTTLQAPPFNSVTARKRFVKKTAQFFIRNGRMYKRMQGRPPLLVVLEPKLRLIILTKAHEELGHHGEYSTWELIRYRFFWPYLLADVRHHVQSCHECQIRSTKKMHIPVTVSTPATLFVKVYIDIMNMPTAHGYRYIVLARDDLSRYVEGRALKSNNAKSLSRFFWEDIYCRYGAIGQVTTDNGPEVKGAFSDLMKRVDIPHVTISSYNSQANGVIERGHFTLREALVKACGRKITQWPTMLPQALFADRIMTSRVTGFSAFYLMHGVHPVLPFDLAEATFMVEGFRGDLTSEELLALRIQQLEKRPEDLARAAETLRKARFRSKEQFEKRFSLRLQKGHYKPGELVLIRNTRIEKELNRKTKPRYLGPFAVVRRTTGGSYILRELDGTVSRRGIAAFRLLPYISRFSEEFARLRRTSSKFQSSSSSDKLSSPNSSDTSDLDSE